MALQARLVCSLVLLALVAAGHGVRGSGISRVRLLRESPRSQPSAANDGGSVHLLNYMDAQVRLRGSSGRFRIGWSVGVCRARQAACGIRAA